MKLLVAGATVVALGLLTAGCSSGSGSKAAASSAAVVTSAAAIAAPLPSSIATSPAAGVSASSTQPTATGTSTGGTTGPVAVCTTLPTSQVASLSGVALTSGREQDFADNNGYTCAYFTASGTGGLSVTVKSVGGATAYANTLSADTVAGAAENVTPVAGIGDKAFSAHDGLHSLFGDRMISVAGLTSLPPAEAIVKALQAKLQ